MAYATEAELATYTGDAAPADAERLLDRASTRIDAALVGAIYTVDDDGDPTDADQIAALRDATCAVVEAWIVSGDEHDQAAGYSHVSLGSLTLSRNAQSRTARGGELPPRAVEHLQLAGLWPTGPEA